MTTYKLPRSASKTLARQLDIGEIIFALDIWVVLPFDIFGKDRCPVWRRGEFPVRRSGLSLMLKKQAERSKSQNACLRCKYILAYLLINIYRGGVPPMLVFPPHADSRSFPRPRHYSIFCFLIYNLCFENAGALRPIRIRNRRRLCFL